MSGSSQSVCRKNCRLAGLAGGVLFAAMLFFVAKYAFLGSVLFGAVIAVLLAFFFLWAFCTAPAETVIPAAAARESGEAIVPPPVTPPPAPEAAVAPEPAEPPRAAAPEPVMSPAAVAVAAPVAAPEKPKAAAKPKAPATPKAPAKAREPAAGVPGAAPKPRTGSALDAALAKSREPVAKAGPELLTAPRGGKPDNLKLIRGVGPKLEKLMNEVGVWHFDQIASWKAKDIAIVDAKMDGFKGRISRDEWVKQAKVLAKGGSTEFSERVARGGVS